MVVRGRPIAKVRSVVPVPVRPSATQRVPAECVCVKLREYSSLTLTREFHRYEVQYIRHVLLDRVYLGCSKGYYCCSLVGFQCFGTDMEPHN